MYIRKLLREINIWRKVRQITKQSEPALNEKNFRVDWIGRVYTVINLPEEVVTQPFSEEGYVLMKLREFDQFFLDLGIADVVFPEMEKLPGTDSYLLVLSPDRDYFKLKPFLKSMLKTGIILIILKILYNVGLKHSEFILKLWNKMIGLIF